MKIELINGKFYFVFGVPFIRTTFSFQASAYKCPEAITTGISSRCEDGRHILFFDYDNLDISQVEDEIAFLQEFFKLSTAYIFTTGRRDSFHVIIPDKFSVSEAYKILSESNMDINYLNMVKKVKGRDWVLRVVGKGERAKPKFVELISSKHNERETSTAHLLFMRKYYKVPLVEYAKEDGLTLLPIISYNTGNRVRK